MSQVKRSASYPDDQDCNETLTPTRSFSRRKSSIFASAWGLLTGRGRTRGRSVPTVSINQKIDDDHHEDEQEEEGDGSQTDETKKRQEAWLQACYNAVAFLLFFISGCICIAVYYILQPFLHPLLWAVLVGMVIHPFKHGSTSQIKEWLSYLDTTGIPLSVGVVLSPFYFFNWMAHYFEFVFISSWKTITALIVCIVSLFLVYVLELPVYIYSAAAFISSVFATIDSIMNRTILYQICTLAIAFLVLVALASRQSEHYNAMKVLSMCLWFLVLLNAGVYLFGSIAVPVVVVTFGISLLLDLVWPFIKKTWKNRGKSKSGSKPMLEQSLQSLHMQMIQSLGFMEKINTDERELELSYGDRGVSDESSPGLGGSNDVEGGGTRAEKSVSFGPTQTLVPSRLKGSPFDETDFGFKNSNKAVKKSKAQSDQMFLILFIACLIVMFWKYPILLVFLVPFGVWVAAKRLLEFTALKSTFHQQLTSCRTWVQPRKWILFPTPIPTILSAGVLLDKTVLNVTKKGVGSLVSAFIIMAMMLLTVTCLVLLFFEIQVEVTHYITVGISVWNSTLANNLHYSEIVKGNDTIHNTLEAFANQTYVYGREWLACQVHSLVGDTRDTSTSAVEARILELFDHLYHSYILKNTSLVDTATSPPATNDESGKLWMEIGKIMSDNLETILSVVKSVWSILSENMTVALSAFSALIQLLFTGSSALFNLVVFLTTLFYLLSYSEADYLPTKWLMDLLPNLIVPSSNEGEDQSGKNHGEAFSKAIRGVFHASFRRAFFSGLYTWLLHTVYGLQVSILPSVIAGIAGAIPFIGSYVATLPAVLELWLIEGKMLLALTLLGLSLLPAFYVDVLINSEIEGGHPYLTGLAIVGGIYFAGLEGALIGPILLCCLLFIVEFYEDI